MGAGAFAIAAAGVVVTVLLTGYWQRTREAVRKPADGKVTPAATPVAEDAKKPAHASRHGHGKRVSRKG